MEYNEQRYNRKKMWYRIRLGASQFACHPILNIIWLFVIAMIVVSIIGKNKLMFVVDAPQILAPIYEWSLLFMIIVLPIAVVLAIFQGVGEMTARRDEADLILAFDKKDLRNGFPILIYKKPYKKTKVIIREFYSPISMDQTGPKGVRINGPDRAKGS